MSNPAPIPAPLQPPGAPSPAGTAPVLLLVDAMHPRARRAEHPRALAAALEAMGVPATLESVNPGRWPVLSSTGDALPAGPRPRARIAYDPFSPAAWLGARLSRRDGAPLLLVEPGWTGLRRLHERLLGNLGNQLWGRAVRGACGRLLALDPLGEQRSLARGFPPGRVALVPTGVDVERFRPGLSSRLVGRHRLGGRLLVAVGPLESGRGLEVLLGAFARSVGQRPDWSLVLVGEGPLGRRLGATADRLGVGAAVHILPWQSDEDLAGLLAAATLFAATDEGDGASGTQVVRAMAAGLPVLVADRPRLAHLVRDGVDGRLVQPGDREAWLGALLSAAGSPDARSRWSRAARERAVSRHAWPQVASGVLALLDELEGAELATRSLAAQSLGA
ncbi:MAG: glycosyltransferase [Planctomycetaceae bacterium]|nr:glycosyltransferase [Planctomycetaceae bacterium]